MGVASASLTSSDACVSFLDTLQIQHINPAQAAWGKAEP